MAGSASTRVAIIFRRLILRLAFSPELAEGSDDGIDFIPRETRDAPKKESGFVFMV
jgi:hypothetical protein